MQGVVVNYKDWVDVLLQCAVIGIILSGLIGYFSIRNKAKKQATKIAEQVSKKIAKEVAERVTNEYIQQSLPDVLESYRSFSTSSTTTDFNVENLNQDE